MRGLTLCQKRKLVCLVATSGVIPNLQLALSSASQLPAEDLLEAAAAAGQTVTCRWLLQLGCLQGNAISSAAAAGHSHICDELLAALTSQKQIPYCTYFASAAAGGGHVALMDRLLRWEWRRLVGHKAIYRDLYWERLLCGVAAGCDLATVQELLRRWTSAGTSVEDLGGADNAHTRREDEPNVAANPDALEGSQFLADREHEVCVGSADGVGQRSGSGNDSGGGAEGGQGDRGGFCGGAGICGGGPSPFLPPETLQEVARKGTMLAAAAGSTTPDWRDKVVWLEEQGHMRTPAAAAHACKRDAAAAAAAAAVGTRPLPTAGSNLPTGSSRSILGGPDPTPLSLASAAATADCSEAANPEDTASGIGRLSWLAARAYPLDSDALWSAASSGNVPAIRFLLARCVRVDERSVRSAAASGHLAALQELHRTGRPLVVRERTVFPAARTGQLHVVAWVLEVQGATAAEMEEALFDAAAASGSVGLLAWLHEQGCPWHAATFERAAEAGCEEALEWLAERGCPMGDGGLAYHLAARQGDLATLRCLARLGCPWGPSGELFARCVFHEGAACALSVLRCLLELGCPLDWWTAGAAARMRLGDRTEVMAWIDSMRGCRA